MRDITKKISLPVDGNPMDFRLTKLDAFSGRTSDDRRWVRSARKTVQWTVFS